MTEDEVRAAAERLVQFHERFAVLFGKQQAQDHAYNFIKGLLTCPERKSIEPIALNVGDGKVSAMQKFINVAPRDHADVQAEIQSLFADELAPTVTDERIGVVGVVDESGFTKKGEHSAGVARQHNGRLGKEDNCQVGVFLVGVAPGGSALPDHQLYLPQSWCEDTAPCRERRAKAHIPGSVALQTKAQIAAGLIRQTVALDLVALGWITADEEYGRDGKFLDELEALELRYVVEVPRTTTVWTKDPSTCVPAYSGLARVPRRPGREAVACVAEVVESLDRSAWRTIRVRQGGKGPLCFAFAAVRVRAVRHRGPGSAVWLLVRRSLEEDPEVKYYISNGDASTPLGVLAEVACTRHEVEAFFEDAKSYLGMAQYETRSWVGWHPHMSLVAMAHLFVTLTRRDLGKNSRADVGSHGAVAAEGDGGARIVAPPGGVAGGVPHPAQQDRPAVAHQDLAGSAQERQTPSAVEVEGRP